LILYTRISMKSGGGQYDACQVVSRKHETVLMIPGASNCALPFLNAIECRMEYCVSSLRNAGMVMSVPYIWFMDMFVCNARHGGD
jgi:hypothetical protein